MGAMQRYNRVMLIILILLALLRINNFFSIKSSDLTDNIVAEKLKVHVYDIEIDEQNKGIYIKTKANSSQLNLQKINLITNNYSIKIGQTLEISGKLKLNKYKSSYLSYSPRIVVIENNKNIFYSINQWLISKVDRVFSPPTSAFLNGLLLGSKQQFSDNFTDIFKTLGITHLLTVSGYNLTLLVFLFEDRSFIRSKKLNIIFKLALIAFYSAIVGFTVSILRAALMSTISLLSKYFGLEINNSKLLLFVLLIFIILNPENLINISFQLTFLACAGIFLIAQPLVRFIKIKFNIQNLLIESFLFGFSVFLTTLPVLSYYFKSFSFLGIITTAFIEVLIPILVAITAICIILPLQIINLDIINNLIQVVDKLILNLLFYLSDFVSNFKLKLIKFSFDIEQVIIYSIALAIFIIFINKKLINTELRLNNYSNKTINPKINITLMFIILISSILLFTSPRLSKYNSNNILITDKFQFIINPRFENGNLDNLSASLSKSKPTLVLITIKDYNPTVVITKIDTGYNLKNILINESSSNLQLLDTNIQEKIINYEKLNNIVIDGIEFDFTENLFKLDNKCFKFNEIEFNSC